MDSDFGNDFITITDENGVDYELEHIDTAEIGGEIYMAFLPADVDEDDDDYGIVILKVVVENGEEILATVDDDDELNSIYGVFIERLADDSE